MTVVDYGNGSSSQTEGGSRHSHGRPSRTLQMDETSVCIALLEILLITGPAINQELAMEIQNSRANQ